MAITGKKHVVSHSEYDIEERVCDLCGADATGLTSCRVCKKDLCSNHQFESRLYGILQYRENNSSRYMDLGVYCADCLIKAVQEFVAL